MSASAKAQRLRNRMPAIDPDAPPPPVAPPPSPVAPAALESVPAPDAAPDEVEASEAPEAAPAPPARPTTPKQPPAAAADDVEDGDEAEHEKVRSGYRSFYVEDDIFTRFRAAIYWSSRRHDADEDVPINMSAGVSEYMERTAAELEKRFNDGEPFRFPPVVQRKKRKTRKTEK